MTSAHPFRLTFGCTYHGIQCRSMEKIILCVDQKCQPALTYNALYVEISRVHEGKNIRVLRLQEGSSGDDWRHRLLCLVPKVMVVKYMLHLNGYDRTHAHLVHLYAQHGIDYDHPIKPPPKKKDGEAPKSFPCPQGCGRSFTAQGYLRIHLLKCKHRSVPDDSRTPDGSTTAQLDTLSLETLVMDNVMCAEQQHEGDFDAAAHIARQMLDDEGRARLEKKGKQRVHKPLSPKSKALAPLSHKSNPRLTLSEEGSNIAFDKSPSKRRKATKVEPMRGGSKGEKRRAVEDAITKTPVRAKAVEKQEYNRRSSRASKRGRDPTPPSSSSTHTSHESSGSSSSSRAKERRINKRAQSSTNKSSPREPNIAHTSTKAQCITDLPSSLVASTEDKLSNHNVQLALDLLGATGKANARSRYMACSMRVHPDTNKLGDSYEEANSRFQLLLNAWKIVKAEFNLP